MLIDENEISRMVVGGAIEVHRTLGGPGLLEGVYIGQAIQHVLALLFARRRRRDVKNHPKLVREFAYV